MNLSIQLKALTISFTYGIILSYLIKIHYNYLFKSKLFYKIIISSLFVFDNCLLYFIILKIISNGMFHIYFIILLIIGYLFGRKLIK